jgi:hypothetical protein
MALTGGRAVWTDRRGGAGMESPMELSQLADRGRDTSEDRIPARRTPPRADERELAAGLVFGVATPGRTR